MRATNSGLLYFVKHTVNVADVSGKFHRAAAVEAQSTTDDRAAAGILTRVVETGILTQVKKMAGYR